MAGIIGSCDTSSGGLIQCLQPSSRAAETLSIYCVLSCQLKLSCIYLSSSFVKRLSGGDLPCHKCARYIGQFVFIQLLFILLFRYQTFHPLLYRIYTLLTSIACSFVPPLSLFVYVHLRPIHTLNALIYQTQAYRCKIAIYPW